MDYTISFRNPLDHFVDIELTCSAGRRGFVDLMLPAWRPGRYELTTMRRISGASRPGTSQELAWISKKFPEINGESKPGMLLR